MIALVIVVIAAVLLVGGLVLDEYLTRERVAARDARINTMWRTMQANQRIHLAFWIARRRMEQEAERQRREYPS